MTRPAARAARTKAVVVAVIVLGLVAVLLGLVGSGGSEAEPAASPGAGVRPTAGSSVTPRPTTTRRPSPKPMATRPSPKPMATRSATGGRDAETGLPVVALGSLPREAQATVALIEAGGPFPYSQDGVTFGNYEKVLPSHPRGWYREYTVRTPGESDRGPRRIVTGDGGRQIFYTGDHYASFVRVWP